MVFAKIRGHLAWPAAINGTYTKEKTIMYDIDFFGSKKEKQQCRVNEPFSFNENKDKFGNGKKWKMEIL